MEFGIWNPKPEISNILLISILKVEIIYRIDFGKYGILDSGSIFADQHFKFGKMLNKNFKFGIWILESVTLRKIFCNIATRIWNLKIKYSSYLYFMSS